MDCGKSIFLDLISLSGCESTFATIIGGEISHRRLPAASSFLERHLASLWSLAWYQIFRTDKINSRHLHFKVLNYGTGLVGLDKGTRKSLGAIARSTQHGMRYLKCGSKPSVPHPIEISEQPILDEVESITKHRSKSYAQAMTRNRFASRGRSNGCISIWSEVTKIRLCNISTAAGDAFSLPLFWFWLWNNLWWYRCRLPSDATNAKAYKRAMNAFTRTSRSNLPIEHTVIKIMNKEMRVCDFLIWGLWIFWNWTLKHISSLLQGWRTSLCSNSKNETS